MKLFQQAAKFESKTAIIDDIGRYTYQNLIDNAETIAGSLLQGEYDLKEERIAFLCPAHYSYVITLWGIWRAGGIAVPLATSYPLSEYEYILQDTQCERLIVHPEYNDKIDALKKQSTVKIIRLTDLLETLTSVSANLPHLLSSRRALIIYTSGTTGKPKGVVSTHHNIISQITTLVNAWQWNEKDTVLNVLPLHHVHGLINVLHCALWSGASCKMHLNFNASKVWEEFGKKDVTVFMAVPTIYHKLIAFYEELDKIEQSQMQGYFSSLRLMVSGSAALPISVLEKWKHISGHTLLERYGMTEIGMALSNSYENERFPGCVGKPLSGVEVKVIEEKVEASDRTGELYVKGENVFLEYWNKPKATQEAFDNGWFKTGDIVEINKIGIYRIVGRRSVDIIKTGGYKVSALEIEEVLREHTAIGECAVSGIEDETYGQIIIALIILLSLIHI